MDVDQQKPKYLTSLLFAIVRLKFADSAVIEVAFEVITVGFKVVFTAGIVTPSFLHPKKNGRIKSGNG